MVLRILFDSAIKAGVITQNPVAGLRISDRSDHTEPWLLDELQVFCRGILKRLPHPTAWRDLMTFLIMIECGPRAEETLNIDVNHWNYETARITVKNGKGKKTRSLGVSPPTKAVIQYYIKFIRPSFTPRNDALLVNRNGRRLTYSNLRKQMETYRAAAGISDTRTLHGFRVTFSVNHYLQHRDSIALKLALGHESIDMVWHYIKIAEQYLAADLNTQSTLAASLLPELSQISGETSMEKLMTIPTPSTTRVHHSATGAKPENKATNDDSLVNAILCDDRISDAMKIELMRQIHQA